MNPFLDFVKSPEFSFCSELSGNTVLSSRVSDGPPAQASLAAGTIARGKRKQKSRNVAVSGVAADDSPADTAATASTILDAQFVSAGSANAVLVGTTARGKQRQKCRNVAVSGVAADDSLGDSTPAAAATVSLAQRASGGSADADPVGATARGKSKQGKLKSSAPEAVASAGLHASAEGRPVHTATAGNKRPQKKHVSVSDSVQIDGIIRQPQISSVLALEQRQKSSLRGSAPGASPLAFSFEGLHDNCRDVAFGESMIMSSFLSHSFSMMQLWPTESMTAQFASSASLLSKKHGHAAAAWVFCT